MAKQLDLRKDFAELYAHVVERVRSFDPATNAGPGLPGPVCYIQLGFEFEQSGWVALVFDTRPDGGPDGEWTLHLMSNQLERPRWLDACSANEDGPVDLVLPDGTKRKIPPDSPDELAVSFGDLLKVVLLKARADGMFTVLQKSRQRELGVEKVGGGYGWPIYQERGKENLA